MKSNFLPLIPILLAITFLFTACRASSKPPVAEDSGQSDAVGETSSEFPTENPASGSKEPEKKPSKPEEVTWTDPPSVPVPEEVQLVNRFLDTGSDELQAYFTKPSGSAVKSDGFVFRYKDEIYILDGGEDSTGEGSTMAYLLDLRASVLRENGIDPADTNYKLKLCLLISHFHSDHMATYIKRLLAAPEFLIGDVYCTEDSAFSSSVYVNDTKYCSLNSYGDIKNRVPFMQQLTEHHPWAWVHEVPYGKTATVRSSDGRLTFRLYAPSEDWGAGEITDPTSGLSRLATLYYGFNIRNGTFSSGSVAFGLPNAINNANSMWVKVTYGERSMLFTGDVMKKVFQSYDNGEPFDLMLSYYGYSEFDVDMVKFPHHGVLRNAATRGVVEVMKPLVIVFTTSNHTVDTQNTDDWNRYPGIWRDTNHGLTIVTDGECLKISTDGIVFETVG